MPLTRLPLTKLAASLRDKPSRIEALTEEIVINHEQIGGRLNAYKTWAPDIARQVAKAAAATMAVGNDCGLLHGIPVSVKDIYGVGGYPTFAGTPKELADPWRREGPVVMRVRQQLAPVTGKTHTVELAFGGLGVNNHWGTPRNPWDADQHRCPGGSSSGAGISLIEGSAMLALGSDTAGSVRIPASMTGNVGLKTTVGRWSTDGIFPLSPTMDTAGILARTVADVAFGFVAIDPVADGDWDDFQWSFGNAAASEFTIGIVRGLLWEECDPGVAEAVEQALRELERAGATLVDVELPEARDAVEFLKQGGVAAAECDEFLQAELPAWRDTLDIIVGARIRDGGSITAKEYLGRRRLLRRLAQIAPERFGDCDVLACPTVPITPPAVDDVKALDDYRPKNMAALRNTCIANVLGLCALSLPAGLDQAGLPSGLQLLARAGDEEHLLAVGLCAEQVLGNARDRLGTPPIGTP